MVVQCGRAQRLGIRRFADCPWPPNPAAEGGSSGSQRNANRRVAKRSGGGPGGPLPRPQTSSGHEIAAAQQSGSGFVLSFQLGGGKASADRFVGALDMITLASSLGGFSTLICTPATMTHRGMPPKYRGKPALRQTFCGSPWIRRLRRSDCRFGARIRRSLIPDGIPNSNNSRVVRRRRKVSVNISHCAPQQECVHFVTALSRSDTGCWWGRGRRPNLGGSSVNSFFKIVVAHCPIVDFCCRGPRCRGRPRLRI